MDMRELKRLNSDKNMDDCDKCLWIIDHVNIADLRLTGQELLKFHKYVKRAKRAIKIIRDEKRRE